MREVSIEGRRGLHRGWELALYIRGGGGNPPHGETLYMDDKVDRFCCLFGHDRMIIRTIVIRQESSGNLTKD